MLHFGLCQTMLVGLISMPNTLKFIFNARTASSVDVGIEIVKFLFVCLLLFDIDIRELGLIMRWLILPILLPLRLLLLL